MGLYTSNGLPSARTLGAVPWAPNTTVPFAMQTNSVIERVDFKVTGTLNLANYANGGAPTIFKEGLENLIRGVRFTGSSKVNGMSVQNFGNPDAAMLYLETAIRNATFPDRVNVGSANGAYQFETNFSWFFGLLHAKTSGNSDVSYLDTRKMSNLTVNFDTRDVTALAAGGNGGTATLSNVQIVISVQERYVNGALQAAPYIKRTLREIPLASIGSGINKQIPNIPLSNFLTHQFIKTTSGAVDYADPTDAIIFTAQKPEGAHVQTLTVGQGSAGVTRFDLTNAQIQTNDRHDFGLEDWPEGYTVLEYSPTGLTKDWLDLRTSKPTYMLNAYNVLDLTLDQSTDTLWIMDMEYVPNN